MTTTVTEASDDASFLTLSVAFLRDVIVRSTAERGTCIIGLSGGKTPAHIYTQLGQDASIDWQRVHLFLCDERYVPADHENSNQRMVRATLLKHAPLPPEHLHFPDTSLPIQQCVASYNAALRALLIEPADIVTLGMGGDGHIASLFPPLPTEAFGPSFAIHTETLALAVKDRISVTLPVLTAARERFLFLKGKDKIEAWQEITVDSADERWWPLKAMMKTGEVRVVIGV